MNSSSLMSRLGVKVTAIALIALAITFGIFLLIYEVAVPEFLYGERFDEYWDKKGAIAFEEFQIYVTKNELTMRAAIQDVDWEKSHHTVYSYLEKYDPESVEWCGAEEYAKHKIQCSDGVVYAFFYPSDGYYYNIGRVIALGVAIACFFLIFLPYVYHVVHRITRLSKDMEVLAGGDLSYKIISTGRDELAELGRDIEGMRYSVLEQMARENESVLANSQLITSLSHDLRTPLTKLTGYLEILQYKKYKSEAEHDLYLSRALDKARQMQSLSDEMFRTFQVKRIEHIEVENQTSNFVTTNQIMEMLTDQYNDLQAEGFQVSAPDSVNLFAVEICKMDLQRIFDNLFSNIRKYADKAHSISVSVNELTDSVEIALENNIRTQSNADRTGIGLPTVQSLLSSYGGRMEIDQTEHKFTTLLLLKKVK